MKKKRKAERSGARETVQIGDIVSRYPVTLADPMRKRHEAPQAMRGKVVYVHPKERFHIVEFGEGKNAVHESFLGVRFC